jgi:SHS2 domain-containing protein
MRKKEMTFRDPVVERVCDKFVSRSDVGFNKYGQTLDSERRTDVKGLADYLLDVQEELMDAVLYIQAAREELQDNLVKQAIKHADHAAFSSSSAQLDWDDAISPV